MRVVLDTNILVSALIAPAGNPAAIYDNDGSQPLTIFLELGSHSATVLLK